jgi:hypothetical protein
MDEKMDKLSELLHRDRKVDRQLERLEDVKALTRIIHDGRVRNARSAEIAIAVVKFLKGG